MARNRREQPVITVMVILTVQLYNTKDELPMPLSSRTNWERNRITGCGVNRLENGGDPRGQSCEAAENTIVELQKDIIEQKGTKNLLLSMK